MGINMAKFSNANSTKIQKPTAVIRYGTISLIVPPASENATVAIAAPLARVASGNISVG
jgi:hypothetical protein